ncbi:MAG TPA: hypothetical protein VFS00_32550, partial [Polyangiaceae bacterium]|nr:hypothetical protein [Polyangiaceae bacterium]
MAHAGLAGAAFVARSRMPVRPPEKIYVVDLLPPAGTINGDVQGKGTPLTFPKPAPAAPKAAAAPKPAPAPPAPHEPAVKPAVDRDAAEPAAAAPKTEKERKAEELREAVKRAMLKPAESAAPEAEAKGPEGPGDKPPLGTPEGVPGGKGKAGLAASYKAVLGGWFAARLQCRGLNAPWEEVKTLKVRASVAISPERKVTSFSINGSGNETYDGCV